MSKLSIRQSSTGHPWRHMRHPPQQVLGGADHPAGGRSAGVAVRVAGRVTALQPGLMDPQATEIVAVREESTLGTRPPAEISASSLAIHAPTPSGSKTSSHAAYCEFVTRDGRLGDLDLARHRRAVGPKLRMRCAPTIPRAEPMPSRAVGMGR